MRLTRIRLALLVLTFILPLAGCSRTVVVDGRGPDPRAVVVRGGKGHARGPRKLNGVPPGHFPPPGQCRIWIPGRPPGHQPPSRPCRSLRGAIPGGAFILYNGSAWDADYDWRGHERRNPGSVPRVILDLIVVAR